MIRTVLTYLLAIGFLVFSGTHTFWHFHGIPSHDGIIKTSDEHPGRLSDLSGFCQIHQVFAVSLIETDNESLLQLSGSYLTVYVNQFPFSDATHFPPHRGPPLKIS